jgi:hypothetical protein
MSTTFDYSSYLDFPKAIIDKEYAEEKGVIVKHFKHYNLYIMKYNKDKLNNENFNTLGKFRSIVTDGKKILSSSPAKSGNLDQFIAFVKSDDCVIENFFEGTMINLFYHNDDWELATKGSIGAKNKFFQDSPHTFRYLFLDAFNKTYNPVTKEMWKLEDLDKTCSYTFILQHPENQIVVPFKEAECCLIRKYKLNEWKVTECLTPEYHNQLVPCVYDDKIQNIIKLKEDFEKKVFKYDIKGFMVYDTVNGIRAKYRNPNYEYVARLKGNNPKLQYQYYLLKQNSKISEYLYYYPNHRELFDKYRKDLYDYTSQLWYNYHECYIKHEKPLKEFPYEYRNHMFFLHQDFLNNLKPNKKYHSLSTVIKYINSLHPSRLMYSINYHYRQQQIDEKKSKAPGFIDNA